MENTDAGEPARLRWLTVFSCVGMALFGYDTGVVSGSLVLMEHDIDLSDFQKEVVVSSTALLAAAGALLGGPISDSFGRKPVITIASILFIMGALMVALSNGFKALVMGRTVLGLAIGMTSGTTPLYVAEAAPPDIRGRLVTLNDFMICAGQVLASVVNAAVQDLPHGWRWATGLAAVPAAVQFAGLFFLPESPRFLVQKGRVSDAARALGGLRGPSWDVRKEVAEIAEVVAREKPQPAHRQVAEILGTRRHLRALGLGVGLMALNQLTAINTVMYYGVTILEMVGLSESAALYVGILCNVMQIAGVVYSVLHMDAGRRRLALRSLTGVCAALALLVLAFAVRAIRWVAVPALMLYLVAFGSGLSGIPWVINSEVYPLHVRAVATGLATTTNWLFNFSVSLTFLSLVNALGQSGTFALYAGVAALGYAVLYLYMPETANLSLEQLQALFDSPESLATARYHTFENPLAATHHQHNLDGAAAPPILTGVPGEGEGGPGSPPPELELATHDTMSLLAVGTKKSDADA
uniref:Major facilitator superfamily (MFS) profile domain-containing protein n=1 Tax=Pyramimonas obovata TaxID=1411642 RepID=A0A6T7WLS0_9CHLO|mmetsp:Transcript_28238/g.61878  ORF Transcript_28238/g.61878 Transcript_28238/m.61878 type:complete len:525 (+) Transcript_28238:942-2516(+)|eukprot:CAMPEP_0118930730 /NCGR_PEP_ID=MMETSP1169-20130426/7315_1 /TAXON_ID=36882 /ORGANISM="Pyramimonas obovata, Strain CCMP722" /LENGTH=524 /DNA_ID=CAMNT_0006873133 /DNA_START=782 /DNA_END=2356 /DNA_ORIENTATION=+